MFAFEAGRLNKATTNWITAKGSKVDSPRASATRTEPSDAAKNPKPIAAMAGIAPTIVKSRGQLTQMLTASISPNAITNTEKNGGNIIRTAHPKRKSGDARMPITIAQAKTSPDVFT
jgi:hypothetical protein